MRCVSYETKLSAASAADEVSALFGGAPAPSPATVGDGAPFVTAEGGGAPLDAISGGGGAAGAGTSTSRRSSASAVGLDVSVAFVGFRSSGEFITVAAGAAGATGTSFGPPRIAGAAGGA